MWSRSAGRLRPGDGSWQRPATRSSECSSNSAASRQPSSSTAALFASFSMASHAGQGCALTSRLLVPKKHHDEIVNLIAQNFSLVRHGDPADEKTYMGPLISERQRDKVDGMVQRAVEAGATLVTGGERRDPGSFYALALVAQA